MGEVDSETPHPLPRSFLAWETPISKHFGNPSEGLALGEEGDTLPITPQTAVKSATS